MRRPGRPPRRHAPPTAAPRGRGAPARAGRTSGAAPGARRGRPTRGTAPRRDPAPAPRTRPAASRRRTPPAARRCVRPGHRRPRAPTALRRPPTPAAAPTSAPGAPPTTAAGWPARARGVVQRPTRARAPCRTPPGPADGVVLRRSVLTVRTRRPAAQRIPALIGPAVLAHLARASGGYRRQGAEPGRDARGRLRVDGPAHRPHARGM